MVDAGTGKDVIQMQWRSREKRACSGCCHGVRRGYKSRGFFDCRQRAVT